MRAFGDLFFGVALPSCYGGSLVAVRVASVGSKVEEFTEGDVVLIQRSDMLHEISFENYLYKVFRSSDVVVIL